MFLVRGKHEQVSVLEVGVGIGDDARDRHRVAEAQARGEPAVGREEWSTANEASAGRDAGRPHAGEGAEQDVEPLIRPMPRDRDDKGSCTLERGDCRGCLSAPVRPGFAERRPGGVGHSPTCRADAVPGSEQPFVMDHEQALTRADQLGERVVVLDAVGHIEGIGLGELLATIGVHVTVACPLPTPMLLDAETMAMALSRMARAGARWRPSTALVSIGDHEVMLIDTLSLRTETIGAVDSVVIRTHGIPDDRLFHELRGRVQEATRVDDAVAVRLADRAIFDGHVAGRSL